MTPISPVSSPQSPVRKVRPSLATLIQKENCEAYRGLVSKYFPAEQVDNALLTMKLESGCNKDAVSPTDDHGLFQINKGLKTFGKQIYDPEFNVKLAYEGFYAKRGWRPWYAVRGILWY